MSRQVNVHKGSALWSTRSLVIGLAALVLVALTVLVVVPIGRPALLRGRNSGFIDHVGLILAPYQTNPATTNSAAASDLAHFHGIAAVRAADAGPLETVAEISSAPTSLRGVAAVRGVDAAGGSATAFELRRLRGVAAVRAADDPLVGR